jgi:hypothetical protein
MNAPDQTAFIFKQPFMRRAKPDCCPINWKFFTDALPAFLRFKVRGRPVLNPDSETGVGGTGDPPVSSGHRPDETGREHRLWTWTSGTVRAHSPFRAAGRRPAQASGLCHPSDWPPPLRISG